MGLDTSHNAWHGPYSSFNKFRRQVCKAAGLGELEDYKGFGGSKDWLIAKEQPLNALLNHSDCEDDIPWQDCDALADALYGVAPKIEDEYYRSKAKQFAYGCRLAAKNQENVEFH